MNGQATALGVLDQLGQKVLDACYKLYITEKNPLISLATQVAEESDPDGPIMRELIESGKMGDVIKLVLEHMKAEDDMKRAMKEYCGSREIFALTTQGDAEVKI